MYATLLKISMILDVASCVLSFFSLHNGMFSSRVDLRYRLGVFRHGNGVQGSVLSCLSRAYLLFSVFFIFLFLFFLFAYLPQRGQATGLFLLYVWSFFDSVVSFLCP